MTRSHVVIPADFPDMIAGSPHLDRLRAVADVTVHHDFPSDAQEQLSRVSEADVMINSRSALKWGRELLEQCPQLRMISTCSIGVDAIDLAAARRQGIVVSNVPGRTAAVVAEHALALLLAVARRLAFTTATMKAGGFLTPDNYVLRGKTLGIIGAGAIGREMIELGRAIGMKVQAWTFHATPERARSLNIPLVELDQLLATSDAISLHVKLTEQSRHMIGRRELARLRPHCLLVNTARGPVIDHQALVSALMSGQLGGAALDVYDQEPLPADDPILTCPHVVLSPHTADQNLEGRELLNSGAVDNVLAYLRGKPQNVVT